MKPEAAQDYIRGGTQKDRYSPDEVTYWACPLCGSENERYIKTEREVLRIVGCADCGLVRVNPRLHHPEAVYTGKIEVYREEYRMVVNGQAPHHRDWNYLRDIERIRSLKPGGRWLDVGTNTGSFLRLARGQGWELQGVEPSRPLGSLAREWWGLDILEGFLEELQLPNAHYDIVTLTDVFEHIVNPKELLSCVRRILKPDGVLFVKVPNGSYNELKFRMRGLLGRPSDNDYDAYEHVCHYSHRTLQRMMESCGLAPREIFVETHVQVPAWHHWTGRYYQHATPWRLDWRTQSARAILYQLGRVEYFLRGGQVGALAPNIGCIASPKGS